MTSKAWPQRVILGQAYIGMFLDVRFLDAALQRRDAMRTAGKGRSRQARPCWHCGARYDQRGQFGLRADIALREVKAFVRRKPVLLKAGFPVITSRT